MVRPVNHVKVTRSLGSTLIFENYSFSLVSHVNTSNELVQLNFKWFYHFSITLHVPVNKNVKKEYSDRSSKSFSSYKNQNEILGGYSAF